MEAEGQVVLPVVYGEVKLEAGYRIDILVDQQIILEIKSVAEIAPINKAQLMTYLKLSGMKLELLLNFNVVDTKKGISRIIM